ncbi:hypothetical protein RHMOL_Rhmol10G0068400 [Rhododendron molle]|uniref:Uncharacterized protein n=1 Tax=Rhododendron molle TaxID=49168 RepID=A0ACC0M0V4_RHOML|nr:hypothetical protein RHMOL_Rhmol10G0068400 [Rhododendron molle]
MENRGTAIEGMELLTEDVLMEILSRLPVKSPLRCKSVSKNWYSLIQNPGFISLHQDHHTRAKPHDCITLVCTDNNYAYHWSMHLLPDETSIQDLDLAFTERPDLRCFSNRGSCNGLMCLSAWSNIMICNPATRESRLLPRPPCHTWTTKHVGFAFDSKTKDYIVVRVATRYKISKAVDMDFKPPTRVDHKIQIYGMSTDSWNEIAAMVPNHRFSPYVSTLMNGVFYWLCYDFSIEVHAIDVLNTVEGSFERRALPVSVGSESRANLCLLNDSLALVVPINVLKLAILLYSPTVMVLTTPFVGIVRRAKYDKIDNTGCWYALINVNGEQEDAAFSKTRSPKNLLYEGHAPFVAKYGQILPIGIATTWDLRKEMDAWLSKIIYYSFLYFSHDHNGKCWFMKYISRLDEDMFMPADQENIFKVQNPNKWILLKDGANVWPVHVINNRMEEGWLEFYFGNLLAKGYRVLFGCERAWIFEAIVLDQNLKRPKGATSPVNSERNDMNPPLGADIRSVCTEAGMYAIRARRKTVTKKDFLDAVNKRNLAVAAAIVTGNHAEILLIC